MTLEINDALALIQQAEESMSSRDDSCYREVLGTLVSRFKHQLGQDFNLPIEFFEPVTAEQETVVGEQSITPEDRTLTPEAQSLYWEIEMGI